MESVLAILLYMCYTFYEVQGWRDYLYFASPGNRSPYIHSGLFGGPVKYQNGGNATGAYQYGFTCVQYESHSDLGLEVKSVAYDMETTETLLLINEDQDSNLVTLLKGSICAGDHGCPNRKLEVVFHNVKMQHKIASFAIHNNDIYFISEKIIAITPKKMNKKIELRKLTACIMGHKNITYPFTPTSPFQVERCSTLVSVVAMEDFEEEAVYQTTSGFTVVPTKHGDIKSIVFFVQLQRRSFGNRLPDGTSNAFVMFRVEPGGKATQVHEEFVGHEHMKFMIHSLGQINYRSGLLCWTALDRIVCGQVDNRARLSNSRTVLQKKDIRRVCRAPPSESELSSIATGVAIARVPEDINRDEIILYFGCMAQLRGFGGAGLLRKAGRIPAQIFQLRNGTHNIYAGSMFMTKRCSTPEGGHRKEPLIQSSAGVCHVSFVLMMTLLFGLVL